MLEGRGRYLGGTGQGLTPQFRLAHAELLCQPNAHLCRDRDSMESPRGMALAVSDSPVPQPLPPLTHTAGQVALEADFPLDVHLHGCPLGKEDMG